MSKQIDIINLHATVEGREILKGVNLTLKTGEIHAIMGPNGTGKSTLSNVIMGNPKYKVTEGDILVDGKSILSLTVDERAKLGIFLCMQNPVEIPGVTNSDFIRAAMKSTSGKDISIFKFITQYDKAASELKMREDLPQRYVNEGFSGGEKKRNEILQMKMLHPNFAILDEMDSGLDVDALKICSENVNKMRGDDFCCLMITHYQRLLDYIVPDVVHVMISGKVVKTGGKELISKIDQDGYDWIKEELHILDDYDEIKVMSLGTCGAKVKKNE